MKYCSQCGNEVMLTIPEGDHRERYVCTSCNQIHYQNPKIVVGCLPVWQGRLLMCKRGIEPRKGLWTLPAGFLENGETTQAGAARETFEETCAEVQIGPLYTMFNLPHISQIYMLFQAELERPDFAPTPESSEVRLFDEADIPWDQVAFPVVHETIRLYFEDRSQGRMPLHCGTIRRTPNSNRQYEIMLES